MEQDFLYSIGNGGITGNSMVENAATQNVKDIFKLLTGNDAEILSVKEESEIYRVLIKTTDPTGAINAQEVFITKDGRLITDKFLSAEDYKASLENDKNFIECLYGKGVRVLGLSDNNYTIIQLNTLGNFWYKIYFDCTGDNLQTCQQLGVKNIPSVVYNQTIYEGVKPAEWFENVTGCVLQKQ